MKNDDKFRIKIAAIKELARYFGYTTKKDIATFMNGFVSGFADAITVPAKTLKVKK